LTDIATGKKPRPPEVDRFAQSFSAAGEKQEKVVDEATAVLLRKLPLRHRKDEGGIRPAIGRRKIPS
jgi:hypothetical protein